MELVTSGMTGQANTAYSINMLPQIIFFCQILHPTRFFTLSMFRRSIFRLFSRITSHFHSLTSKLKITLQLPSFPHFISFFRLQNQHNTSVLCCLHRLDAVLQVTRNRRLYLCDTRWCVMFELSVVSFVTCLCHFFGFFCSFSRFAVLCISHLHSGRLQPGAPPLSVCVCVSAFLSFVSVCLLISLCVFAGREIMSFSRS